MNKTRKRDQRNRTRNRTAAASIDYVLVLAVIVQLIGFLLVVVPEMIQLVYEMTVVAIGTPLM